MYTRNRADISGRAALPPGILIERRDLKKNSIAGYIAVGLVCAAVATVLTLGIVVWRFGGLRNWDAVSKFSAVLRVVEKYYVGDSDTESLEDTALSAMVGSLDQWSYYMNADEYADYLNYSANQYQGIGVSITKDEQTGGFLINSVTEGGPAEDAGVMAGEIIVAADRKDVTSGTSDDLRSIIQADYGGQVALTLQETDGTTRDVTVSCEVVQEDPVHYEMLDGNVGYIKIANFETGSAQSAEDAVKDLIAQGAGSLIFDVRDDPGGQVSELVDLLDYLLPEGNVFIRDDKQGNEEIETSDASCVEMPMTVLVNANSYSAAEFFAAALSEYHWATVVGEHTTGKGRSQVTVTLSDGSAVHISHYTYLTPDRVDLSEAGGLAPDQEVAMTDDEENLFASGQLEPADDPQVQAALAVLGA